MVDTFFSNAAGDSAGHTPRSRLDLWAGGRPGRHAPGRVQVGRILYASGRTVPWQRVINHYGGISTYKVGSGEQQRALLENEGVSFKEDGTLDLKQYQWQPSLRMIKKLRLPEEVAFHINARLPFSHKIR